MIKSALIAMTILGCNCEQNTCEYIRTADIAAVSMADCRPRMKAEIERTDGEYPLLVAVCEPPPAAPAKAASSSAGVADPVALDAVATTEPAPRRSILVRGRQRYSAIMDTARDGIVEFVTVPAGWLQR